MSGPNQPQIGNGGKDAPAAMDEQTMSALREIAGWPIEVHSASATRDRIRTVTVLRDHLGRVIGSTEVITEHEHETRSHSWGK